MRPFYSGADHLHWTFSPRDMTRKPKKEHVI